MRVLRLAVFGLLVGLVALASGRPWEDAAISAVDVCGLVQLVEDVRAGETKADFFNGFWLIGNAVYVVAEGSLRLWAAALVSLGFVALRTFVVVVRARPSAPA